MAISSGNIINSIINNLRRIFTLRKLLRNLNPDAVLSFMPTANVTLALALTRGRRYRAIGSEHTHPPSDPLGFIWETLRAKSYSRLDAVVALTEETATWLAKRTRAKQIKVISNPVIWPLPSQTPWVRPPDRVHNLRFLLAVGRLDEVKGFHHLIEIFSRLKSKYPNWRLVIVGEGDQRVDLEKKIQEYDLIDSIQMPGAIGNIGDWYSSVDIYVMTSRTEGFPNTLIEAMSYGLPVISFDCKTGPRDIINHGVNGLLIPDQKNDVMIRELARLMDDSKLRLKLGQNAKNILTDLTVERISKNWQDLLFRRE